MIQVVIERFNGVPAYDAMIGEMTLPYWRMLCLIRVWYQLADSPEPDEQHPLLLCVPPLFSEQRSHRATTT